MARVIATFAAFAGGVSGSEIMLATFDGAKETSLKWVEQDDPVMGGKSKGSFTIDSDKKVGIFNGTCAIVPSLNAPGFIKAVATGSTPDVSSCKNLVLNVNSENAYKGFRVSFGDEHYPSIQHFFARGFKSDMMPPVGKFADVVLPFSGFTDHWDDGTGKAITKCVDDSKACPTQKRLQNLETLSIWGEGVEGDLNLQIKSIRATECKETLTSAAADSIDLATFDGKAPHKWQSENDPVMGGKSSSTVDIKESYADYQGSTRIVPQLGAPGFTIALTSLSTFPDVSSMDGLTISLRAVASNYTGYKIAFCDSRLNFKCQFASFKADLPVPQSLNGEFQDVFLPWSKFSDKWSSSTGKHTAEEPPTASNLKSITQLQIWTEGVEGDFHLQFQSVRASKAPKAEAKDVAIV